MNGKQTALRLPQELMDAIEAYRKQLEAHYPPGVKLTAATAMRVLLQLGLESVTPRKKR